MKLSNLTVKYDKKVADSKNLIEVNSYDSNIEID